MILDQEDVVESGAAFAPLHVHNALDSNVSVKSMGPIFCSHPNNMSKLLSLKNGSHQTIQSRVYFGRMLNYNFHMGPE